MRVLLASVFVAWKLFAADRCSPPAEFPDFERPLPENGRSTLAVIEQRLRQTPDDWTLNRLLVDSSVYQKKLVRDRIAEVAAAHPESLDYQYLRARSLVGSNTKEALRIYGQILEKDPDYPWIHLSQLEIFRGEAFRNRAGLAHSFSTLIRVCPGSFTPYRYLNEISDDELAAKGAAKLRILLSDAKSPRDLALYKTLWAVEFRLRPKSEVEAERKRIALDLERLNVLELDGSIRSTIQNGARLINDTALMTAMAITEPRQTAHDIMKLSNAWLRDHPRPKADDSAERKKAYGEALLGEARKWRDLEPDNEIGYADILRALVLLKAPDSEIAKAGDDLVAIERRKDFQPVSWIPMVAREYTDAGVLLDRVPALIAEAILKYEDPEAIIEIDLAPSPDITASNRSMIVQDYVNAMATLAKCYEKLGQLTKAHAALRQAEDFMVSHPFPPDEKGVNVRPYRIWANIGFWQAKGELAEMEGKTLEALTWYQRAYSFNPHPKLEFLVKAHKLWDQLGGSEEGWKQWGSLDSAKDSAKNDEPVHVNRNEYSAVKQKLPPMSLRDTEGKLWTLDQLAGKTTIAVAWATWCEPCVAELPYFAILVDRLKGRKDVLAISLNTDDNIALAESFVKSAGYKFTVLAAKRFAEDLMPLFSIPRTWIIRDGMIVDEAIGFGRNGEKWIDEMLAKLH